MKNYDKEHIIDTLRRYLMLKRNQGYLITRQEYIADYNKKILLELTKLENLSVEYVEELKALSKGIRKFLWYNCNSQQLYCTLFNLNEIYKLLFEKIKSVELILDYITHLSYYISINNSINVFEKMRDDVYLTNAKVIISKMWQNVLSSDDGSKSFKNPDLHMVPNILENGYFSLYTKLKNAHLGMPTSKSHIFH